MTTTEELEVHDIDDIDEPEYEDDVEEEYEEDEAEEVEPEVIEVLTKTKARALHKQILSANAKVNTNMEKTQDSYDALLELLNKAVLGQIHVALEYKSWPAYVQDTVQINVNDRAERKSLVTLMSGKGMPQKAIAAVIGKSQKTVDRDLDGAQFDTDTVTNIDGVQVPRNKKRTKKVVEEVVEEEVAKPTTAAALVEEFNFEVENAHNAVAAMVEIMTEPKWPGARKRVAKAHLNHISEWIESLQNIADDLTAV